MLDWILRRISNPPQGADPGLAGRLATYPPYSAPHTGWGAQLSEAEALENLAYFMGVMPQRLQVLGGLLKDCAGIDLPAALHSPREQGLLLADSLHVWAARAWPALIKPHLVPGSAWAASARSGDDLALSLALDVAMALGEVIRRANPAWRWGVDLNPVNLKDGMLTARRVVLVADPVGAMPHPFVLDVEDIVVARYRHPEHIDYRMPGMNPWRRLVDEGQRGAHMAFWKTTAAGLPKT